MVEWIIRWTCRLTVAGLYAWFAFRLIRAEWGVGWAWAIGSGALGAVLGLVTAIVPETGGGR